MDAYEEYTGLRHPPRQGKPKLKRVARHKWKLVALERRVKKDTCERCAMVRITTTYEDRFPRVRYCPRDSASQLERAPPCQRT